MRLVGSNQAGVTLILAKMVRKKRGRRGGARISLEQFPMLSEHLLDKVRKPSGRLHDDPDQPLA
jgi:hypothetical protein